MKRSFKGATWKLIVNFSSNKGIIKILVHILSVIIMEINHLSFLKQVLYSGI